MPNNDIKNYKLFIVINKKEIELLHDSLINIDRFTSYYTNNENLTSEICRNLKIKDNEDYNIVLKSSRGNSRKIIYKNNCSVIKEFNNDFFFSFLLNSDLNELFEHLNKMIEQRTGMIPYIKIDKKLFYLWEDIFSLNDLNEIEQNKIIKIKNKFSEINKELLLKKILNNILIIRNLNTKIEIESFLRDDYVEQEKDKRYRLKIMKKIEKDLNEFLSNYRNYRDLYLLYIQEYNSKIKINEENELLFINEIMNKMKKNMKNKLYNQDEPLHRNFKIDEEDYVQNLINKFNNIAKSGDEEGASEIRDELSKYMDSEEVLKLIYKL